MDEKKRQSATGPDEAKKEWAPPTIEVLLSAQETEFGGGTGPDGAMETSIPP